MDDSRVVAALEAMKHSLDVRHAENQTSATARHQESSDRLAALERAQADLQRAFPGGDANGHRVYHEEIMQSIADRKRIRQAILEHVLKTSTWLMIAGLGLMALVSLKNWLRGVVGQ